MEEEDNLFRTAKGMGAERILKKLSSQEGLTLESYQNQKRRYKSEIARARTAFKVKIFRLLPKILKIISTLFLVLCVGYFTVVWHNENYAQAKREFLFFVSFLINLLLGALLTFVFQRD